jgi:hypothetical protein
MKKKKSHITEHSSMLNSKKISDVHKLNLKLVASDDDEEKYMLSLSNAIFISIEKKEFS